ncbi:hypothetical protein PI124_g17129 [Phytophthora idaei]|nr:hypothetical protein PI125_g19509 [Phytophthora idaei]KAG3149546.1 hypothetical protein PI126_g11954 [Phytophthora idaei]KAG3237897.1 hypothetical protein PI124_g17129 [Phytophthora idaei]
MLRTLSPTEQHGVALGFIVKEQRDATTATTTTTTASSGTTPRVQSLKLHVSNYVGKEGEPLLRWLVEVDIAIAARRIFDQPSKVAFAMSCRGGRARSWAYGRRHTGATCFSAYAEFKKELRQGFSLAILKTAAPCERDSHCKKHDDKPKLVIQKVWSKGEGSLRAPVDSGASNNFVRQQSLPNLNFEDVDTPRRVLEARLATGATVRTAKRVVRVRFSYKHRVFVENLIVLDLDEKLDLVLAIPSLARHDPVINWEKRTLVRFGRNATEGFDLGSVARAPQSAPDHTVEAAPNAIVM